MSKRILSACILILSIGALVSCGDSGGSSGGACVQASALGAMYNFCQDNYDESECSALSDSSYYGGKSCSDIGYTLHCSGDSSTTYRQHCP